MTSSALGAFIDLESSNNSQERQIVLPPKALARTYSVQDPIELADFNRNHSGPSALGHATASGTQTPRTPSELGMSRPATPRGLGENDVDGVEAMQSFSNPPMNKFRMLSVCLLNFGNGLNDSAPGALIPYIEKFVLPYAFVWMTFWSNIC
jgi:hypothetical protein